MCLSVITAGYAPENIICWKVMLRKKGVRSAWSPFQGTCVLPEILDGVVPLIARRDSRIRYTAEHACLMRIAKPRPEVPEIKTFEDTAGQGFIHVYLSPRDLLFDIRNYYAERFNNCIGKQSLKNLRYQENIFYLTVYECYIPKGSLTCEGKFGGTNAGCAESIMFKKEITDLYVWAKDVNYELPDFSKYASAVSLPCQVLV